MRLAITPSQPPPDCASHFSAVAWLFVAADSRNAGSDLNWVFAKASSAGRLWLSGCANSFLSFAFANRSYVIKIPGVSCANFLTLLHAGRSPLWQMFEE